MQWRGGIHLARGFVDPPSAGPSHNAHWKHCVASLLRIYMRIPGDPMPLRRE